MSVHPIDPAIDDLPRPGNAPPAADDPEAAVARSATARRVLARTLADRRIPMAFQPVVALDTGEVVGFEALARPRDDGPAARPVSIADLHRQASCDGTLGELDWLCRASAMAAAGASGLPQALTWFVNSEPETLGAACPTDLAERIAGAPDGLRVFTEVTERSLESDPFALLRGVRVVRGRGDGVAVDDVGVNPASLAVLPLIEPEVVKLDMSVLGYLDDPYVSRVCAAVRSFGERTRASMIVEGIETPDNLAVARIFGARYGQGYHFGRAGALPRRLREPVAPMPLHSGRRFHVDTRTPFEVLSVGRATARTTKRMLVPLTLHLERQADERIEPLALLTSYENPAAFSGGVRAKYDALASSFAFVALFGPDADVDAGSRTQSGTPGAGAGRHLAVDLADDDPLTREWNVIVLGPHYAAALSARSVGDTGPDLQRRFDYVLTYEREAVEQAARAIASRFATGAGRGRL